MKKYESNWESSPRFGVNIKNIGNHHPVRVNIKKDVLKPPASAQLFEKFPQDLGDEGFIYLAWWLLSHLCCRSCCSLCSLQATTQTRFHASAGCHFRHLPEEFCSILQQHLWRTRGIHVVGRWCGGSLYLPGGRTCWKLRLRGEKAVAVPGRRSRSKGPAQTEQASAGQQPASHRNLSREATATGPASHLWDLHHGKKCKAPPFRCLRRLTPWLWPIQKVVRILFSIMVRKAFGKSS